MSAVRRIAQNTVILVATQVVVAIMALIYGIYAARYLGPDSFGILTFALSLAQLANLVFGSGLAPLTLREVSADMSRAPWYLGNAGLLRVGLAALSLVAVALFAYLMGYPSQTVLVVLLIALAIGLRAATEVPYAIFRAFEMMQYIAIGQILNAVLMLVGLAFALAYDFTVVGFAWLYVAASGLPLLYVAAVVIWRFFLSRRPPHFSRQEITIEISSMRRIRAMAFPFAMATVGMASLHYADSVMLSAMVADSNAMVGWYNAAYRMVDVLGNACAAFAISVTPVLVQAYTNSRELLAFMCQRLLKYYLIIALPIGVGTTMLAERFVLVIYGRDYAESGIVLQILIWAFVIGSANLFPMVFQAIQRARTVAIVVVSNAVLNIILNLVVIPRFTYTGAAATTVAASAIGLITFFVLFSKTEYYFSPAHILKLLARLIPAAAAMGLVVWFLPQLHLGFLIPIAAIVYFAALALMRTFDATDFSLLTSLVTGQPLAQVVPSPATKDDIAEH